MRLCVVSAVVFVLCIVFALPASAQDNQRRGRYQEFIKKYDKDGDGKLNDDERKAMRDAFVLRRYDKDGDGKLNDEEKAAAEKGRKEMEKRREEYAKRVKEFDKDGDGELSREERRAMYEAIMLERYDKDGDGKLNEDEKAAMEKAREEMRKRFQGRRRPRAEKET
jgi:Ca2+-binding EF-hand superfamily protein